MKSKYVAVAILIFVLTTGAVYGQQSSDRQQYPDQQPSYRQPDPDGSYSTQQPGPDGSSPAEPQAPAQSYPTQTQQTPDVQYSPQPQQPHETVPQALESLRHDASSKTEFTLDHSMLVFASKLSSDDESLRRVIAGLSGISVHRFHFPRPGMYNLAALRSMKEEYKMAGWKQLVNNHEKGGGPGGTGLWVRFENNAISDVAILLAKADSVNFIVVSGSISPLDLVHLGGHFGIPKIEGGVLVPNNKPRS
jgi:hypothetical protein